jgi:hypothetical protein
LVGKETRATSHLLNLSVRGG